MKNYRLVLALPTHQILAELDREHEAHALAESTVWRGPVEVQERRMVEGEGEVWVLKGRKETDGKFVDFVHGEANA